MDIASVGTVINSVGLPISAVLLSENILEFRDNFSSSRESVAIRFDLTPDATSRSSLLSRQVSEV
jgi:hypothetical protein